MLTSRAHPLNQFDLEIGVVNFDHGYNRFMARRPFRDDPTDRMQRIVDGVEQLRRGGLFTEAEWEKLDRSQIDGWITGLRKGEASLRGLRKRLEALRDDAPTRLCEYCRQPFAGRSDARFCSVACRVKAYRYRPGTPDTQ
jgi:hypothetical protein